MIRYTLTLFVAFAATAAGQVNIISEPSKVSSSRPPAAISLDPRPSVPRPAVVLTSWQACPTGYCFEYSNGTKINETFAAYTKRTGKLPLEARSQCSTGYCGTFSRSPTIATGNCRCGCNASTCSCHHSANAGKPLSAQKYEPGKVTQALDSLRSQIQWR